MQEPLVNYVFKGIPIYDKEAFYIVNNFFNENEVFILSSLP